MSDFLDKIRSLIGTGWAPDVETQGVRPDWGLTGAQIRPAAKSPYERTFGPGETANLQDLREVLGDIILAGGSGAVPGIGGKQDVRTRASRAKYLRLGFPNEGQSKPFSEQRYKYELPVKVTWPDGSSHIDSIKGLNRSHALERARFNWEGAEIEPYGGTLE